MMMKVMMVEDDKSVASNFPTPEHIIYNIQAKIIDEFRTYYCLLLFSASSFPICTRLCFLMRACLYFIQKFFICKTLGKSGVKTHRRLFLRHDAAWICQYFVELDNMLCHRIPMCHLP